ncbi:MAG: hypothetical protein XFASWVDF_001832, partial [Candidatus Fervidibacter sp.]
KFNRHQGHATTLPSSFHFHLASRYSPVANRCRFGSAGASPSQFAHRLKSVATKRSLLKQANLKSQKAVYHLATRYSPLAVVLPVTIRCRFTNRYSPVANRCRFGSALASPFHSISSPVPRPTPLAPFCFRSLSRVPCPLSHLGLNKFADRDEKIGGEGVHESLCCEAADF